MLKNIGIISSITENLPTDNIIPIIPMQIANAGITLKIIILLSLA